MAKLERRWYCGAGGGVSFPAPTGRQEEAALCMVCLTHGAWPRTSLTRWCACSPATAHRNLDGLGGAPPTCSASSPATVAPRL